MRQRACIRQIVDRDDLEVGFLLMCDTQDAASTRPKPLMATRVGICDSSWAGGRVGRWQFAGELQITLGVRSGRVMSAEPVPAW